MNTPTSTFFSSVLLEGPPFKQPNRKRHTWRWRLVCLAVGFALGWALRTTII